MDNTCVFCGEPIPEGRMVCPACEDKYNNMEYKLPVKDYRVGDVCIYSFGDKNKSCSVVQIVKILEDERGIAEVKFLNVVNDDSGNGLYAKWREEYIYILPEMRETASFGGFECVIALLPPIPPLVCANSIQEKYVA